MGTTRKIPDVPKYLDVQQNFSMIPIGDRVFTENSDLRKILLQYTDFGLPKVEFENILENLKIHEFTIYLRVTSQVYDSIIMVAWGLQKVPEVIKILALTEPSQPTALLQIFSLSGIQRKLIIQLSLGVKYVK